MVDQRGTEDSEWPPAVFEEWVEQTAAAEDVSEQELLHRMMASFWVLSEFEDLVGGDQPDVADLDAGIDPAASPTDHAPPFDAAGRSEHSNPAETDADADADSSLAAFLSAAASYLDDQTTAGDRSHAAGATADAATDASANDADPAAIEDVRADLDSLADDHADLADDHADLADRVDHDFAQVEKVLRHLVDEHRSTSAAVDDVETALASLVEDRRRERAARARLDDLLAAAHEHGVETGACEHCDARVSLALLTDPSCPHCGVPLAGVEPGGWFRADVLTTAPAHAGADPSDRPTSTDRDADAGDSGSTTGQDAADSAPDGDAGRGFESLTDAVAAAGDAAASGDADTDTDADDPFEWSSL